MHWFHWFYWPVQKLMQSWKVVKRWDRGNVILSCLQIRVFYCFFFNRSSLQMFVVFVFVFQETVSFDLLRWSPTLPCSHIQTGCRFVVGNVDMSLNWFPGNSWWELSLLLNNVTWSRESYSSPTGGQGCFSSIESDQGPRIAKLISVAFHQTLRCLKVSLLSRKIQFVNLLMCHGKKRTCFAKEGTKDV